MTTPLDPASITIDLTESGLIVNGAPMLPDYEQVRSIFGEPRRLPVVPDEGDPYEKLIWDDYGLSGFLIGGALDNAMWLLLDHDEEWAAKVNLKPGTEAAQPFRGTFTVDGRPLLDGASEEELEDAGVLFEVNRGDWETTFWTRESISEPFEEIDINDRIDMRENGEFVEWLRAAEYPFRDVVLQWRDPSIVPEPHAPSGKYDIPQLDEPLLHLPNLEFKLMIMQELMFNQEVLEPRFKLLDFHEDMGEPFDLNDYINELIPQVRDWFMAYPIPRRLGALVESLEPYVDDDVYMETNSQWDGEDDLFEVASLSEEELEQFPNLRTVDDEFELFGPEARRALEARGVEFDSDDEYDDED